MLDELWDVVWEVGGYLKESFVSFKLILNNLLSIMKCFQNLRVYLDLIFKEFIANLFVSKYEIWQSFTSISSNNVQASTVKIFHWSSFRLLLTNSRAKRRRRGWHSLWRGCLFRWLHDLFFNHRLINRPVTLRCINDLNMILILNLTHYLLNVFDFRSDSLMSLVFTFSWVNRVLLVNCWVLTS